MATVLVVEDNRENLELMVFLLRAFGHEPIPAPSGARAVELARERVPDIALVDIQMPEMDGFETARALRENEDLDGVPFVAVTALAMPGDRELILKAGFTGYIAKPIEADRLAGQIASFLPPPPDAEETPR
ncbi:MAG TPA: response regulator [Gaiellaceae bacterium]|nr:response regulator [Gaiellaceae bacterium]